MEGRGLKESILCECTKARLLSQDTAALEFAWKGPPPLGGQFFLIKPERTSVFLARPISVAGFRKGLLRFLIAGRGRGSNELIDMKQGEKALLIGPLGNSWPIGELNAKKSPIALIGGGIGIAPLLITASELKIPFDFYAGFRSRPFGLEKIKARSLIIATEDGSEGKKGRILDFFKPEDYGVVFACGPEPMLKSLAGICKAAKVPAYLSVETHMACGVGACLACKVKTTVGNLNCCTDGPIFKAEELVFDE
ncbi:MAG: dihydroorotate dehydrogenase electron transfer subunit [Treponema sp.]|nr:dihydroorotate dehydrogenase electron transfer subunit [Treponema sp.]